MIDLETGATASFLWLGDALDLDTRVFNLKRKKTVVRPGFDQAHQTPQKQRNMYPDFGVSMTKKIASCSFTIMRADILQVR